MECSQKYHLEDKEKPFFVCSLCECALGMHFYFVHCPLLEDEVICIDCCHEDVPREQVVEEFKKLGLNYTKEYIDATCMKCGTRCVGKDEESHGHNELDLPDNRSKDS